MIAVFLANGFEEIEALATVDILRRAGYETVTVGVGSRQVEGSHKIPVTVDIADDSLNEADLDMVILPGGMPGTLNLEKSMIVQSAVRYCVQRGKYIAAICAAPSILGHMGILRGRRATCFPGYEKDLEGADVSTDFTCVDGKIITGKGAGAAVEFALKIVEVLSGTESANKLRMSMQCI